MVSSALTETATWTSAAGRMFRCTRSSSEIVMCSDTARSADAVAGCVEGMCVEVVGVVDGTVLLFLSDALETAVLLFLRRWVRFVISAKDSSRRVRTDCYVCMTSCRFMLPNDASHLMMQQHKRT
jgi:hypothetical protein